MNLSYRVKNYVLLNLDNNLNLFYSLRILESNNTNITINRNSTGTNKKQIIELCVCIASLVAIIIVILGLFTLYKRYIEKRLMQELDQENQYILNMDSSKSSSFKEGDHPYSFNNGVMSNNQNYDSELGSQNNYNNSFDYNHEERMENIRKKYGNSLLIKILLKKKIEEVQYNNNYKEDYGDNCTICMNNFLNDIIIYKTPCEHIFHKECFNKYLKNIQNKDKLICPNCNQNLLVNKKYLKLRVKAKKIKIDKKVDKKDINNYNNEITNKNIEIDNNSSKSNNEDTFIIIKKIKNKEDKFNNISRNIKSIKEINIKSPKTIKKESIYNSINDPKYKRTVIFQNNKEKGKVKEKEKEEENNTKMKEIFIQNLEKSEKNEGNIKKIKIIDKNRKKSHNFYLDNNHGSTNDLNSRRELLNNNVNSLKNVFNSSLKDI